MFHTVTWKMYAARSNPAMYGFVVKKSPIMVIAPSAKAPGTRNL